MRRFGLGAVVAATLLLALPAVASADTFTVNDDDAPADVGPGGTCGPRDHATIAAAIAAAGDGDTIRVCAGTYAESVEVAGTTVELLGAQAGVDARTRAVPAGQESIIDVNDGEGSFDLTATGVTVDGFTVAENEDGAGIVAHGAVGFSILNNVVTNADSQVIGAEADFATIRHNRLIDPAGDALGVGLFDSSVGVVDENLFEGGHNFAAIGIGLFAPGGNNIEITGNESVDDGPILVSDGHGVEIDRNVITNPLGHGIILDDSSDVDVTRNRITNPGEESGAISLIPITDPSTTVDVNENTLLGDGDDDAGIFIQDDGYNGQLDAHFNRIVGNSGGIVNLSLPATVDAINNWWGCNEGANEEGCDSTFNALVETDFDPWLVLSASADPTSITTGGDTSTITSDLLTNSDGEEVGTGFPDGSQIDFATNLGTLDPLFDLTENAVASTTLTSGADTGTANVEATLDNETVTASVEIGLPTEGCEARIDGTAGNDRLTGTQGSELIRGRAGRDKVDGLGADDCVKGGSGPDKVVGGSGEDRVRGGAGDDKVRARDGETDVVRCGAGDDTAKVDGTDQVRGCEKVKRA